MSSDFLKSNFLAEINTKMRKKQNKTKQNKNDSINGEVHPKPENACFVRCLKIIKLSTFFFFFFFEIV